MNTDLFEVVKRNSIRQVKLVLEAGYNVNIRNERLETPLMACVMHVHDSECRQGIIRLLVASGADVNLANGRGQTVFMYGCILNQLDTVLQFLQFNDINPEICDSDGNTGLMYACALGNGDIVRALLEAHNSGQHLLDLEKKNYDGLSALEHAAECGHLDVVKLFTSDSEIPDEDAVKTDGTRDSEWRPDDALHSEPTNRKARPLQDKAQQIMREVQEGSRSESKPAEVSVPSEGTSVANEKNADDNVVTTSVVARPPSRARRIRSAVKGSLQQLNEDDQELSLENLGELVITVRECAREIREICDLPGSEQNEKKSMKVKSIGRKSKNAKTKIGGDKTKPASSEKGSSHKQGRKCGKLGRNESPPSQINSSAPDMKFLASYTSLNKDLSSSPENEIQDGSLLQEKQILDKVMCRLTASRTVWGDQKPVSSEAIIKPSPNTCRSSKATMMVRDQFSSFGNPLPSINRMSRGLPPVRHGLILRPTDPSKSTGLITDQEINSPEDQPYNEI